MKERTLQEWANFTGWYAAMDADGSIFLYETKPSLCTDSDEWNIDEDDKKIAVIPMELVDNDLSSWDWKDSLHCPDNNCPACNGSGEIWVQAKPCYPSFPHKSITDASVRTCTACSHCNGTGIIGEE